MRPSTSSTAWASTTTARRPAGPDRRQLLPAEARSRIRSATPARETAPRSLANRGLPRALLSVSSALPALTARPCSSSLGGTSGRGRRTAAPVPLPTRPRCEVPRVARTLWAVRFSAGSSRRTAAWRAGAIATAPKGPKAAGGAVPTTRRGQHIYQGRCQRRTLSAGTDDHAYITQPSRPTYRQSPSKTTVFLFYASIPFGWFMSRLDLRLSSPRRTGPPKPIERHMN